VAMDKPMAKKVFEGAGLRCPKGVVIAREELGKGDPLPRPYVMKPVNEGSSVGVYIVTSEDNRPVHLIVGGQTVDEERRGKERPVFEAFLVEEYIPGRELTVAVLDDRPLGVTEIKPRQGFYDYAAKYTDGKATHLCPAPLPKEETEEAMRLALAAHRALGCRGLSRADFRYDDTKGARGVFYLLEVNTQPGMTPLSLSPELAAHAGIDFKSLVGILIEGARLGN